MPLLLSVADDFRHFQDLTKKAAGTLLILLEEVKDSWHKLLDILQSAMPSRAMLPIIEALLDPAKTVANI